MPSYGSQVMYGVTSPPNSYTLQSSLSASSTGVEPLVKPHHPITCMGPLFLHEDGRFACEHAEAPADDPRTQQCLNHSIAIMIIEEAFRRF